MLLRSIRVRGEDPVQIAVARRDRAVPHRSHRALSRRRTRRRGTDKSRARRFDGDTTHVAVDPDDELVTVVTVTPGNPDRVVVDAVHRHP